MIGERTSRYYSRHPAAGTTLFLNSYGIDAGTVQLLGRGLALALDVGDHTSPGSARVYDRDSAPFADDGKFSIDDVHGVHHIAALRGGLGTWQAAGSCSPLPNRS